MCASLRLTIMALLEVKNLIKTFSAQKNFFGKTIETVKAVNNVSLQVEQGEVLGLVGESGCGKSTLGRTILRLLDPDSGTIRFKGQDITHLSRKELRPLRKEMQIIFQDPYSSLNPRMTVGAAIIEPLTIHKIVPTKKLYARAVELLQMVGLDEEAMNKYPHEFSGGQRQRVGIARALAVEPKLIIADEAVSALDISIQAQVINLLMDLKDKLGLTMIFIAHDLKVVEHISDRICVMYLGKVMEVFPATELEQAKHPYTQSLLSAVPVANPHVKVKRQILQGDVPSPIHPPSGCVFHTRCPKAVAACSEQEPRLRSTNAESWLACDVV